MIVVVVVNVEMLKSKKNEKNKEVLMNKFC